MPRSFRNGLASPARFSGRRPPPRLAVRVREQVHHPAEMSVSGRRTRDARQAMRERPVVQQRGRPSGRTGAPSVCPAADPTGDPASPGRARPEGRSRAPSVSATLRRGPLVIDDDKPPVAEPQEAVGAAGPDAGRARRRRAGFRWPTTVAPRPASRRRQTWHGPRDLARAGWPARLPIPRREPGRLLAIAAAIRESSGWRVAVSAGSGRPSETRVRGRGAAGIAEGQHVEGLGDPNGPAEPPFLQVQASGLTTRVSSREGDCGFARPSSSRRRRSGRRRGRTRRGGRFGRPPAQR